MDIDIMQAQLQRLIRYLPMLDQLAEERGMGQDVRPPGETSVAPSADSPNLAQSVGAGVQREPTAAEEPHLSRPR